MPISFSESGDNRHLDCLRYDKCLDIAYKKKWRSFSCSKCPRFKEYHREVAEGKNNERIKLALLLEGFGDAFRF